MIILAISAALKVIANIADEEDTGLGILLSWTQEKAAKTGDHLDGFLMKTHTIQEDEQ